MRTRLPLLALACFLAVMGAALPFVLPSEGAIARARRTRTPIPAADLAAQGAVLRAAARAVDAADFAALDRVLAFVEWSGIEDVRANWDLDRDILPHYYSTSTPREIQVAYRSGDRGCFWITRDVRPGLQSLQAYRFVPSQENEHGWKVTTWDQGLYDPRETPDALDGWVGTILARIDAGRSRPRH